MAMFLWRWFKRLVYFAVFCGLVYIASGYVQWGGEPVRDRVKHFFASTEWQEGQKDLRMWLGAMLQLAGKKIEEGITPADQQKLDAIFHEITDRLDKAEATTEKGTTP